MNNSNTWTTPPGNINQMSSIFTQQTIRVRSLIIRDTGTYHEQFYRPYEATSNPGIMKFIADRDPQMEMDAVSLSRIAGQFITPSAMPGGNVTIPNGWGEKRLMFFMEVEVGNQFHSSVEIITGYTDYLGASQTGAIDHQMTFYVNGISKVRTFTNQQGNVMMNVMANNQVLANINTDSYNPHTYQSQNLYTMKPSSIIRNVSLRQYDHDTSVRDTTIEVGVNSVFSSRDNASPVRYLANIVSSYQKSQANVDYEGGHTMQNNLKKAYNHSDSIDGRIENSDFMMVVSGLYNFFSNAFTYGDLMKLDPNVAAVTRIVWNKNSFDYRQGTQQLSGSDIETRIALIINNALPAMMMEFSLTKVVLTSTNRTLNSQPFTKVSEARTYASIDVTPQRKILEDRLSSELMRAISVDNLILYELNATCNVTGDTTITVSVEGKPAVPFTFPTFCDSLYTPILTRNINNVANMASNVNELYNVMTYHNHAKQTSQQYQPTPPMMTGIPVNNVPPSMVQTPMFNISGQGPVAPIQQNQGIAGILNSSKT